MQRRYAIKQIALLVGGVSIAPDVLARALANGGETLGKMPADRLRLLAEMAETILPETDTPGAKAAKVEDYISIVVEECFPPQKKESFWRDLENADAQCKTMHGRSFVDCDTVQRTAFFNKLQDNVRENPTFSQAPAFFTTLKDLTLNGYFTSEIGSTQALAYDPIPGGWVPDMEIDDNTKAWTPMF